MNQAVTALQPIPVRSQPGRLSESFIWKRQTDFYESIGIDAWRSGTIPTRITTNSRIARDYAQLIASYVIDTAAKEFTIVELGAGHGRFGFLCVQHLKELQQSGLLPDVHWQYILTDVAERNIQFWEQHESIKAFIDDGTMDVARYGAGDAEIQLRHSGKTIAADRPTPNMVVIGNYLFDSIPIDVYQIEENELFECLPEITVHSEAAEPGSNEVLHWQWKRNQVNQPAYSEPDLQFLVDYFKTNFDNTCFTVPVTGCQSIAMLDSLSENGLLLLMADKGHVLERDLNGRTLPTPIPHGGCYSFSVNFLAFAKWFEFGGGSAFLPEFRDSTLQVAAFATGHQSEYWTQLNRQYRQGMIEFSSGDYHQVARCGHKTSETLSLRHCLSMIRLSACEPLIFYSFRRHIREAVRDARKRDRQAVWEVLETVAKRFFHWGTKDIPFEIGHIYESGGKLSNAIQHYRNSIRLFGQHPATLVRLATCFWDLEDSAEALKCVRTALELKPESKSANALLNRIQSQSPGQPTCSISG